MLHEEYTAFYELGELVSKRDKVQKSYDHLRLSGDKQELDRLNSLIERKVKEIDKILKLGS